MMRASVRARSFRMTLALLAAGVAWVTVIDRPPAPRPVRTAPAGTRPEASARLTAPPGARAVLARADALVLTSDQRARLASLADAWDREVAPLDAALRVATEEFARFAREAQQAGRVRLDDVSARTEDVQSLSALVRERRARHADAALSLLTASQRAQLGDLRRMTGGTR